MSEVKGGVGGGERSSVAGIYSASYLSASLNQFHAELS